MAAAVAAVDVSTEASARAQTAFEVANLQMVAAVVPVDVSTEASVWSSVWRPRSAAAAAVVWHRAV